MFEEKENKNTKNLDESELNKLRTTVLKWVDVSTKPKPLPKSVPLKKLVKKTPELIAPLPPKIQPIKYKHPRRSKQGFKKKIIITLIILVVLIFLGFGANLYITTPQGNATKLITKVIPYPIGLVGWHPIYYYDWINQTNSLEQFYNLESSQNPGLISPSREKIEKHIIDIQIEKELVRQLAKKYELTVSDKEIDSQLQYLITQAEGEQNFSDEIKNLYNWDISEFKKEILQPLLLKNKLSIAITLDDRLNNSARKQAQDVLQQVKTGKKSFEEIAFAESQDPTSVQGGDLGYFGKGQMVPEFEKAVFGLNEGQVSEIVKTQFGFHIIKLEDKLLDEDGNVVQVRARHILVRGKTLSSYLEKIKESKFIFTFVK